MNINAFFNQWTETNTLHMKIPRSLIHEPEQARYTHEYTSFFNPWTEKSELHMSITRSLIHEPKQAHYT